MAERELPLFPLQVVLFPGIPLPLRVFEERYKDMMRRCLAGDKTFGVVLIKSGQEVGGPAVPHDIGTTAQVEAVERLPDGKLNLVAEGVERFRILELLQEQPYLVGRVELLAEARQAPDATVIQEVEARFRQYLEALAGLGLGRPTQLAEDPHELSFQVAAALRVPPLAQQALLQVEGTDERLRLELRLLKRSLDRLRLLATAPGDGKTIGPFSTS